MSSVLLVEDNLSLCKMEERHIHAAFPDAELQLVHTGTDASRAVDERLFDAVVMDCRLPECDCLELLDHIAKAAPHTAVIVVSADPPKLFKSGSRRQKIFDIIEKPFEPKDLINALRRAFGRSASRGDRAQAHALTTDAKSSPIFDRHEMMNILAGMKLGLRAFELDLEAASENSPEIRETIAEYVPKILKMVERAAALVKQAQE